MKSLKIKFLGRSRALLAGAVLILTATQALNAQVSQFYKADINVPVESTVEPQPDGSVLVTSASNDTWGTEDSFSYLYQRVTGDFDVQVQVVQVDVDDAAQQDSAKASLMARVDLAAGAPNIQMNALPDESRNTFETIYRPTVDSQTDDMPDRPTSNTSGTTPYPNVWLRMRRTANQFTTYYSNDGFSWTTLSSVFVDPLSFPRTLLIGLSTVAHISPGENQDNRVRATYQNFKFNSGAPEPTVNGVATGANGPGVYPNKSVSAVNWKMTIPADGLGVNGSPIVYNAANKNDAVVTMEGQGPIPWSAPGFNQGDMDINLGVSDATSALSNTGPYGPNYSQSVIDPLAEPAQGWYPGIDFGLIFATIRKNGQQHNDGSPAFYGFPWVSVEGSSRRGFNMLDGVFRSQDLYVSFGKLGENAPLPESSSPRFLREANIDSAIAWFPYAQGWKGGYVAAPSVAASGAWIKHSAVSPALSQDIFVKNSAGAIVTWEDLGGAPGGAASLALPNVNSLTSGMLFTLSSHEGNDNHGALTAAAPKEDGSGWLVVIRADDEDLDPTSYAAADRAQFQFLYVPYTADKLIGGYIRGATGAVIQKAGDFTLTRLAAGRYGLTIPGKTGANGMLLLGNAGYLPSAAPDDGALSYEYIGGQFVIESRHVEAGTEGADLTPLHDTDFYFAYVDFQNPLAPAAPAPAAPSFHVSAPTTIHPAGFGSREAGIAINTDANEALVVTTITDNSESNLNDPITGEFARHIMVGYFIDPTTFEVKRGPFPIVGNPDGNMENHAVRFNPVSKKYAVFTTGQTYRPNALQLVFGAIINPDSVAGANDPVVKRFVVDPTTTESYDDVGMAVSTKNGNMLLIAERNFLRTDNPTARNEGVVGFMFDKDGNQLTPTFTRLDVIEPDQDEDDPDISYVESRDVFFFHTNTDPAADSDRIVGYAIAAAPTGAGALSLSPPQQLAELRKPGINQGHPTIFENPFNGELIGALDYNNGPTGGDLFYLKLNNDLSVTPSAPQVPYLDAGDITFNHRHPIMAADPNSGVIALIHNFTGPFTGIGMTLLGPDGQILPGRPAQSLVYTVVTTESQIDSGANFLNIVHDPHSDSLIAVYSLMGAGGLNAVRITIDSDHLPESTGQPSLSIQHAGATVKILWPASASAAGYLLQSTPALGTAFGNVGGTPVREGEQDTITVTPGTAAFYRLAKP